jgi:hypothetical protein
VSEESLGKGNWASEMMKARVRNGEKTEEGVQKCVHISTWVTLHMTHTYIQFLFVNLNQKN